MTFHTDKDLKSNNFQGKKSFYISRGYRIKIFTKYWDPEKISLFTLLLAEINWAPGSFRFAKSPGPRL